MTATTPKAWHAMLARWRDDLPWYAYNCLRIIDKDRSLVPLLMNRAQLKLQEAAHAQMAENGMVRIVVPKARQLGISTWINARGFHKTQFRPHTNALIITHRDDATQSMLDMLKGYWTHTPVPVGKVDTKNARELAFTTPAKYRVGTAGGSGAQTGRGFSSIDFFHWSEVAYCDNATDIVNGALQAVPTRVGTEVWLESTGRGPAGYFYDVCKDALAGQGPYKLVFLPWHLDDAYVALPPAKWQPPEKWLAYGTAHGLRKSQLYWAYLKNTELLRGDADRAAATGDPDEPCHVFQVEYPATVSDCWRKADQNKLINAVAVAAARRFVAPEQTWAPIVLGVDVAGEGADATTLIDRQGRIAGSHVFEKLRGARETTIAARIMRAKRETPALRRCFVDVSGGRGSGVVDICQGLGADWVTGVNYSAKATRERYANKRAEMWWRLKGWIEGEAGVQIPDHDELSAHVLAPLDLKDLATRQYLEPKKAIIKREGFSPDWGDALAQTFAEDVEIAMADGIELRKALGLSGKMWEPAGW